MTEAPQDAPARREALDTSRSFIVQAPAGSGKTGLLTQRYLALLAQVDAPEEVVAITFTRKAAGEMRGRILQALAGAREAQPPAEEHARLTWTLARAALARDAAQGWDVLAFPARLRVQTIDSLCAVLARQMPWLSGFGSPPATTEQADVLYREAARATVELLEAGNGPWTAAVRTLLAHLDNRHDTLEGLLMGMLRRRDQWLRHIVQASPAALRAMIEAAIGHLHATALGALAVALPPHLRDELAALATYAAGHLARSAANGPLLDWCLAQPGRLPGCMPEHLAVWCALTDLLLTAGGEWRRRLDKNGGFPAGTGKVEKAHCAAMKARMSALLDELAAVPGLLEALRELRAVPPAPHDASQWAVLEALLELLLLAAGQLQLVFRARGEVDFIEVGHRAVQALGTPEQPTDLALALDYRIRHLLVDEFQDTSLSQYELLERLTAGWMPGDGRTLFAVGDPMQSIYRFRDAQVGLYLKARREGIGAVRLEALTLTANFRSQGGVVAWVNSAFPHIFPAREEMHSGAIRYTPATATHPPLAGPAVTVHPVSAPAAEAERVLAVVQAARRERPGESIAILVRSRSHGTAVMPALQAAGLNPQAVDLQPLATRSVIKDLTALTRALVHPADRLAWLALLRAPWCGLTLSDLARLAEGARDAMVWALLDDPARLAPLSVDGRQRLARLVAALAPRLRERRRLPLRRWVEDAWLALGGPACYAAEADLEDARVFLGLLDDLDDGGDLLELTALEERLDQLHAQPDRAADGSLQVMTMHKAKGLEFDTVILPGLGRAARRGDPPLLAWAELPRPQGAADLLLAPIAAPGAARDPIFAYLQGLEKDKESHEIARLLYVAATRARTHLHLVGHAPRNQAGEVVPVAGSLLARLWPVVRDTFEQLVEPALPAETAGETAPAVPLRRLGADWRLPAPPAAVCQPPAPPPEQTGEPVPYDWAGQTIRCAGSVVHRLLQQIATDGLECWSPARLAAADTLIDALLRHEGVADAAERTAAATTVREALQHTLADSTGRWLLEGTHTDARNELPLSGMVDGGVVNGVIDRTFVDKAGVRWIVDYKTSRHGGGDLEGFLRQQQERYRLQLETYGRLWRAREPARPIRLCLYFPLLARSCEWTLP